MSNQACQHNADTTPGDGIEEWAQRIAADDKIQEIKEWARRTAAEAPPLTQRQKDRLGALLQGGDR